MGTAAVEVEGREDGFLTGEGARSVVAVAVVAVGAELPVVLVCGGSTFVTFIVLYLPVLANFDEDGPGCTESFRSVEDLDICCFAEDSVVSNLLPLIV